MVRDAVGGIDLDLAIDLGARRGWAAALGMTDPAEVEVHATLLQDQWKWWVVGG